MAPNCMTATKLDKNGTVSPCSSPDDGPDFGGALVVRAWLRFCRKRLGEGLLRYRLLTRQPMKRRRRLLCSVASSIIPTVMVILILLRFLGRKNELRSSGIRHPLTLTVAAYGLASFPFVDTTALCADRSPGTKESERHVGSQFDSSIELGTACRRSPR